jgi:hypothetical protein
VTVHRIVVIKEAITHPEHAANFSRRS